MKPKVKFEKWKTGTFFVIRLNGKIVTYTKKEKRKTKAQYIEEFKTFKTVSRKRIKEKKQSGLIQETRLGRNTVLKTSERELPNQPKWQITAVVDWAGKTTTGYSDIKGTRDQAFSRARTEAKNENIITYYHKIEFYNANSGVAIAPDGKTAILFHVKFVYQTYVHSPKTKQKIVQEI